MKRNLLIKNVFLISILTGVMGLVMSCEDLSYNLSESAIFVSDNLYESGTTVNFGDLTSGSSFYKDCGLKNLRSGVDGLIHITSITVTGDFEVTGMISLIPFDLLSGDTFDLGVSISPVEIQSYSGTITFFSEDASDSFTINLIAQGVAP